MKYDLRGFVPRRLFQTDFPLTVQTLQMQLNNNMKKKIKLKVYFKRALLQYPRALFYKLRP